MDLGAVHGAGAVIDNDGQVIQAVGRRRRGQHARIGVDAGDQQRVHRPGSEDKIQIGGEETVFALFAVYLLSRGRGGLDPVPDKTNNN